MKRQLWEVAAEDEGLPLDQFLSKRHRGGLEAAAGLICRGAVYVQGKRAQSPDRTVRRGEKVMAILEERGEGLEADARALWEKIAVLREDASWIIVSKPAGLVSQPTQGRAGDSLWDWARSRYGDRVGLVHRLDRETSGVLVLGRTPEATAALSAQFQSKEARKRYLAVVGPGFPAQGRIELPISKDRTRIGRRVARAGAGQAASTDYSRVGGSSEFSLVELRPLTGRTHQLRAHLRALGYPIAGDRLYEGANALGNFQINRCLLHALELRLRHPRSGEVCAWVAEPPEDFGPFLGVTATDPRGLGRSS